MLIGSEINGTIKKIDKILNFKKKELRKQTFKNKRNLIINIVKISKQMVVNRKGSDLIKWVFWFVWEQCVNARLG